MKEPVWIPKLLYLEMCALGAARFPFETGGMLIGYVSDNEQAVVTATIGPGPKAKHAEDRFVPDSEFQQAELTAHYFRTEGKETYLGDWHTHPEGYAALSRKDEKTLARIALTPSSGTAHPLMLILAGGKQYWELEVVRFLRRERRFFFYKYEYESLTPKLYDS
jgi:integrative and conjugative element protein (TIGR02256 family)